MDWEKCSFLLSSKERKKIFLALMKPKTPTQIAKEVKKGVPQVSRTLKLLVEEGLVECKTPEARKGRIYAMTKEGEKLLEHFKEKA